MENTKKINYKQILKIAVVFLAVFFVVGLCKYANSVPAIKKAITLATTVKPETFTELYFEDHNSLPKKIELGKKQSFKFTIHNLEYQDTTYKYEIKAVDDKENITLSSGWAMLSHNKYITIDGSYMLATASGRMKIQVLLMDRNQSIHFLMEGGNPPSTQ